jgi:NitT/TauT family transport system substrate-binding protein
MAVMVNRLLAQDEPDTVRALVRALNRGLRDTVADPEAAVDALVRRNPAMNRASNHRRLLGTLELEMAGAEGGRLGLGELDDTRLQAGMDLIATTQALPRRPAASDIFCRDFLPPLSERVRSLARG